LCSVEKAVVSTTLPESDATWQPTRGLPQCRRRGRHPCGAEPGRDILVLNSATLIQYLLKAGLVDDLRLSVVPVLLGGGLRLLPAGVSGRCDLSSSTRLPDGALGLHYRWRLAARRSEVSKSTASRMEQLPSR
jgi:dihydrofolate reductase